MNELKKRFEANMLDGDRVESGGNMLSAESVWEYFATEINDMLDRLRLGESNRHGNMNYAKGYNQAVSDLNEKIEKEKVEL